MWAPFISSVPIYVYVPVVLGLLGLHGSTAYWATRRIRELQGALNAKDVLLDFDNQGWAHIHPGGTMVLTLEQPTKRIRITSRYQNQLKVETE